jgi:hypothetical protein
MNHLHVAKLAVARICALKSRHESADNFLWENLIPLRENLADAPELIWTR